MKQRHPFRRTLTLHQVDHEVARDDNDLKLFALSFTAFFVCFYTFVA
ncbi:hypothetical protein SAMN06297144_2303 [Sphingomonas guangdongensis]|uniref:Uncharacterized protein n=1 Tax=Sphingomonas guangdongensis TaxID=1141890 RepID=A0A285R0G5_9SPHN|nr:hypothetical protein [Sphingomonas guangdongensis]SOB87179.1 hypothetical protein SAMN06297144_2303 [Sphingomonas guangdongensis]